MPPGSRAGEVLPPRRGPTLQPRAHESGRAPGQVLPARLAWSTLSRSMLPRVLERWLSRWRAPRTPVELRLYTKANCPLCGAMKAELARARVDPPFRLLEVDIEG